MIVPDNTLSIQRYWHDILDVVIPWKIVFATPYTVTRDPKLRNFQHKLIMKYLPSNRLLFTWGLIESPLCSFCKDVVEDYFHLFWDCRHISQFWNSVNLWFNGVAGTTHAFNATGCILGDITDQSSRQLNLFLLLGRYYIFKCKLLDKIPAIAGFKLYVKFIIEVESRINNLEEAKRKFIAKWGLFSTYFD